MASFDVHCDPIQSPTIAKSLPEPSASAMRLSPLVNSLGQPRKLASPPLHPLTASKRRDRSAPQCVSHVELPVAVDENEDPSFDDISLASPAEPPLQLSHLTGTSRGHALIGTSPVPQAGGWRSGRASRVVEPLASPAEQRLSPPFKERLLTDEPASIRSVLSPQRRSVAHLSASAGWFSPTNQPHFASPPLTKRNPPFLSPAASIGGESDISLRGSAKRSRRNSIGSPAELVRPTSRRKQQRRTFDDLDVDRVAPTVRPAIEPPATGRKGRGWGSIFVQSKTNTLVKETVAAAKLTTEHLLAELERATSAVAMLTSQKALLEERLGQANESLTNERRRALQLTSTLQTTREQLAAKESAIASLSTEAAEARADYARMREECGSIMASCVELDLAALRASHTASASQAALQAMEQRGEEAERRLTARDEEVARLRAELRALSVERDAAVSSRNDELGALRHVIESRLGLERAVAARCERMQVEAVAIVGALLRGFGRGPRVSLLSTRERATLVQSTATILTALGGTALGCAESLRAEFPNVDDTVHQCVSDARVSLRKLQEELPAPDASRMCVQTTHASVPPGHRSLDLHSNVSSHTVRPTPPPRPTVSKAPPSFMSVRGFGGTAAAAVKRDTTARDATRRITHAYFGIQ
jgi:hypothetical protein